MAQLPLRIEGADAPSYWCLATEDVPLPYLEGDKRQQEECSGGGLNT
jgi:hypothetical protein